MPKKPAALGRRKARTERVELIRSLYIDNYPQGLSDMDIEQITDGMGMRIPRNIVWRVRTRELRGNIVHSGEASKYTYRPTPREYAQAHKIIAVYEALRDAELHRP